MTKAELAARNIARIKKEKAEALNEIAEALAKELLRKLNRLYTGDPYTLTYACGEKIYRNEYDDYIRLPNYWDEFNSQIGPIVVSILKKYGWALKYNKRKGADRALPDFTATIDFTIIADPEYEEPVTPLGLLDRAEAWLKKYLWPKKS